MRLLEIYELYNLISRGTANVPSRKQTRSLRKAAFDGISDQGFSKVAFDTRRVDQETEFNPRRGLQNYNRSEAFLSESTAQRVKNFSKLRNALNDLKRVYGREYEWQDSNARILLTAIDKGLRTDIEDGDFATNQPGVGSFDYLEELLNVRYRLNYDDLTVMGEADLKKAILSKDEDLLHKDVKVALDSYKNRQFAPPPVREPEITKHDVTVKTYDSLVDKLFDNCKASEENPDVERTITITIRDRFHKEGKEPKEGKEVKEGKENTDTKITKESKE